VIPTIEQIIEDLLSGTITKQQAIGWLHQHAAEAGRWLRDDFAAAALNGLCTAQEQDGAWQYGGNELVAETAYKIADEMLKARDRTSLPPTKE
jgi:hypothetical protein